MGDPAEKTSSTGPVCFTPLPRIANSKVRSPPLEVLRTPPRHWPPAHCPRALPPARTFSVSAFFLNTTPSSGCCRRFALAALSAP